MKTVAIIGGGIAGLTVAYELSKQKGYKVTLFEQDSRLGGLASSFPLDGYPIERYYHFICRSDTALINLIDELGLKEKLCWRPTSMGFFYKGQIYPFSSPFDLLRFKPLNLIEKLRFGINVIYSRNLKYWHKLESISARDWLIAHLGRHTYDVIWHPLLKVKFGKFYDSISASWIWHRIHRVATSRKKILQQEELGYLEGGTQTLIKALSEKIYQNKGTILTKSAVKTLHKEEDGFKLFVGEESHKFDCCVSTVSLPIFVQLVQNLSPKYAELLQRINYIGVVCMLLVVEKSITPNFWLNVNDPRIPFNGIIEFTNLDPNKDPSQLRKIVYIPYYLITTEERFSYSDEELLEEYVKAIKLINPKFSLEWISNMYVYRDQCAQPCCTTGFSHIIPPHKTPIDGLYLIDSSQLYPADRHLSGTISLAIGVCRQVMEEYVKCNLCGADDYRIIMRSKLHVDDRKEMINYFTPSQPNVKPGRIVKCQWCGLVYTNPRENEATISGRYEEVSDPYYAKQRRWKLKTFTKEIKKIEQIVPGGTLLEIGSSCGFFLEVARQRGWQTYGVELSKWACSFARKELNEYIFNGTLEEAQFPSQYFDLVYMSHVLEHIPDPTKALMEVNRILKVGGFVFIELPDIESFWARILKNKWWFMMGGHLYHFSKQSLQRLVEKCGFEVIKIKRPTKSVSLEFFISRINAYNKGVGDILSNLIQHVGLNNVGISVNLKDLIGVYAIKKW